MSVTTIMVPMRDGAWLATDVNFPNGPGPFSAILERTPYARAEIAAYFTAHGYAVVYQDTRSRYGSEGVFMAQPRCPTISTPLTLFQPSAAR